MNTPTPPPVNPADRLGLTLFFALAVHTTLILGVGFDLLDFKEEPTRERSLEVIVVQNPLTPKEPEESDFLAPSSQEGGGTLAEKARPKTLVPPPPLSKPKPAKEPLRRSAESASASQPKPPTRLILTQKESPQHLTSAPPTPPKVSKERVSTAQLLASTNREIARLNAELDKKMQAYAKRPRRKSVTASTKEFKYANYLDAWRRKVERIGNLNYPDEAKRRKLYGNLILHVAVRADGTLEQIRVLRSSGHKLLDDAAVNIVRLAAPYAAFPAEIRKETDILDITRTWQFLNDNRLGWDN